MKRNELNNLLTKVEVIYSNADLMKTQIVKENSNKCGVYLWSNILSGKTYVGSSINLGRRFKSYFTYSHISSPKRSNSLIHKAILKYGYSNFQLEILEYCEPTFCHEREQYYMDLLKPEYNILTKAGSSEGYTHNEDTLKKMQAFLKKHNAKKRLPVQITDIQTNITKNFDSIVATAAALNTNEKNVRFAAKHSKLLLKRYVVKIEREP